MRTEVDVVIVQVLLVNALILRYKYRHMSYISKNPILWTTFLVQALLISVQPQSNGHYVCDMLIVYLRMS